MARTGKIARLPRDLREQINEQIRDGKTARQIIDHAARAGHPGLTDQNLTNWRQGGYQAWLDNQRRIEEMRVRADLAVDLAAQLKEANLDFADANELLVASQINDVLSDFNPEHLKALLQESPKQFFNLVQSVTSQSNEKTKREKLELDFQKYKDQVERSHREATAELDKLRDPNRELTPDENALIVDKIDRILGLKK